MLRQSVMAACAAAAAASVTLIECRPASASFTVDLLAVSATGSSEVLSPKLVRIGAVGDVVQFELWGRIQGQDGNPNNDGVNSFVGSFITPNTGTGWLRANVTARAVDPNFAASGHSNGTLTDLDADGDLDVGSNDNVAATNFFAGRSINAPDILPGALIRLGTMSLTVSQIAPGPHDSTTATFRIRQHPLGANWFEDGVFMTAGNGTGYLQGASVQFVPEPGTAGTVTLLTAGSLARRRRRTAR